MLFLILFLLLILLIEWLWLWLWLSLEEDNEIELVDFEDTAARSAAFASGIVFELTRGWDTFVVVTGMLNDG